MGWVVPAPVCLPGYTKERARMTATLNSWPALPLEAWRDTYDTLHMWTQVVGKLALALSPLTNHYWNTALQITPRGLATLPLPVGRRLVTRSEEQTSELP